MFDGMLYAKAKRAMIPHGFLTKLDISKAKALPGVIAVLTAEDIPAEKNHGLVIYDWPVMVGVGERVRYVGDAIAVIAAETFEIANQASALIEAEFDLQPVITNPVMAREEGVPQIHEKGNLLKHIKVRKGDMEQGFAESDVILEHTFHTQTTDHAFLEPECSISVPLADGRIYTGRQAKEARLVDELGDLDDAIHIAADIAGMEGEPKVVEPRKRFSFRDIIESRWSSVFPKLELNTGVKLKYLMAF